VLSNANSASARFLKDTSQFEKSSWTANLLDPHSHQSRHRLVFEYFLKELSNSCNRVFYQRRVRILMRYPQQDLEKI